MLCKDMTGITFFKGRRQPYPRGKTVSVSPLRQYTDQTFEFHQRNNTVRRNIVKTGATIIYRISPL